MKTKEIILSVLSVMFVCFGCEKDNSNQLVPGPEIEWVSSGTAITYTYSAGVVSGYYFHRSFNVLNESGEVSIDVQVLNDDNTKVSGTFTVDKDTQYSLEVRGSKSSSQVSSPGETCLTVVFSSPNSLTKQEIRVDSYLVSGGIGDTYYCPKSLTFGEISISM